MPRLSAVGIFGLQAGEDVNCPHTNPAQAGFFVPGRLPPGRASLWIAGVIHDETQRIPAMKH